MKKTTFFSLLSFLLLFAVGSASAQNAASTPARAAQFEQAAKASGYSRAYSFIVSSQNIDGLTTFCENYTGIGELFCTTKFKDAQPGSYCILLNTENAQYGIAHIQNMLQQQGYSNVDVKKMQQ